MDPSWGRAATRWAGEGESEGSTCPDEAPGIRGGICRIRGRVTEGITAVNAMRGAATGVVPTSTA